ncbi:MAG: clostripain-related cysteine peptidase, partial [Butyricicoccus sp.]|nr:clostripain-related cysteine peptidase [Butyricicoccus sp.]
LLGGGGGLTALLGGGGSDLPAQQPGQTSQSAQPSSGAQSPGASLDLSSLFGSLGGGSVSTGWQSEANTGKLDKSVASGAREKYVKPLGGGRDTVTLMVYMCGTDLESRSGMGTADLQEMLGASFGDNINLLVYTGGCKGWKNNLVSSSTNQIWQVKNGGLVSLENDLGSVSMTKPETLSGYISWCAKKFPASRYGLIFWDHGGGSVSGYGYDEKFASSGSMNLAGIDTALGDGGVKFDFIGFDACLMATAETALTLTKYADYLIASEETEPGVGWYYTDWLTELGKNTSMPTIELGQKIVDSFVDTCAEKCRGQLTTLSVIDLAELEATLPGALAEFSRSATKLIADKDYQTVSSARAGAREFASSSKIDQVDLVHLARNLGTDEGEALAKALLGAVKYNRTSSNMTNAYGISIYFPYQKASTVDKAVSTYKQIGMDEEYMRCIRQFASLEASGQAVSGGTASPLPSLMGSLGSSGGGDLLGQVLEGFLSGGFGRVSGLDAGNSEFLSDRAMSDAELAEYLEGHRFDGSALVWSEGADGAPVMALPEEQWALVQTLELNVFYDDGEGYIDLGLDNVYDFDEHGALLGTCDGTWLAIDGQPVAYYHTCTVDDGESYTITGRVPVLWNGERAELLLSFDNERPYGYVAGVRSVYAGGETDTVAKSVSTLEAGDALEFICDYYGYGGEYLDSYLIGEPLAVTEAELEISSVPLEGSVSAVYRFTDLFNQQYWSLPMATK